jgi:transposase
MKRARTEIDLPQLCELVDRATVALLKVAEADRIKAALRALAAAVPAGRSSEKTQTVVPSPAPPASGSKEQRPRRPGHGRTPAGAYVGAARVPVAHPSLRRGEGCPLCPAGKVYPLKKPRELVRIVGQAPLAATVYELEKLRCNGCGEVFTAPAPAEAGERKYDETAAAMSVLLKYGAAVPWYRLAGLEQALGVPLPASVQWQMAEESAEAVEPVFAELLRQAAQGGLLYNDDTSMRVLKLERPPADTRTGVFTSGVVSRGERLIALFFTGRQHAGENLGELLKLRVEGLPPPIQMSDALSRNVPKREGLKLLAASCLAHGRRQFVEVAAHFPAECRYVLETLGQVYYHDAQARTRALSAAERLAWHQEQSAPLLADLRAWCDRQLDEHLTEPNSGLGKAIQYLRNHWDKLTLFLREPGAPLDNNLCERALKPVVLHRKNALFYKTRHGAEVGDLFMSLIHTCALNAVNAFDYLTQLLRHAEAAGADPARWMPWNYAAATWASA